MFVVLQNVICICGSNCRLSYQSTTKSGYWNDSHKLYYYLQSKGDKITQSTIQRYSYTALKKCKQVASVSNTVLDCVTKTIGNSILTFSINKAIENTEIKLHANTGTALMHKQ